MLTWFLERLPDVNASLSCPWFVVISVVSSAAIGVFVADGQALGSAAVGIALGYVIGARRPESCQT